MIKSHFAVLTMLSLLAGAVAYADDAQQPTFHRDVLPLLQKHCQECHRPGQVAPMALLNYDDARPYAKAIRKSVASRTMPPWFADSSQSGVFRNERSLNESEIATFERWVEAGAPAGDPSQAPAPLEFSDDWVSGTPDVVLGMRNEFAVPAQGSDILRCFVLDISGEGTKWLKAIEFKAGNRAVDHHAALFLDRAGRSSTQKDAEDPEEGYACFGSPGFAAELIAGWAPGAPPYEVPDGVGIEVPQGAKVVLQMHYHPTGKPEMDRTEVGFKLADGGAGLRPQKFSSVGPVRLQIPAGEAEHVVEGSRRVMRDMTIHSAGPHMHLLGKSMEMWAELPDGARKNLFLVPRYDFYWQSTYDFREPVTIPAGSTLKIRAEFDNSAENPRQPTQPPKDVRFGETSTDEMCFGVFFYTDAG